MKGATHQWSEIEESTVLFWPLRHTAAHMVGPWILVRCAMHSKLGFIIKVKTLCLCSHQLHLSISYSEVNFLSATFAYQY